jgi:hypothetical protein
MKDTGRIFEGAVVGSRTEGDARVLQLPVARTHPDPAPHPVYSLDGLLALALAVRDLEVTG